MYWPWIYYRVDGNSLRWTYILPDSSALFWSANLQETDTPTVTNFQQNIFVLDCSDIRLLDCIWCHPYIHRH